MRIVSLQPSITVTLAAAGAIETLVGCTRYCVELCPELAERAVPVVEDSWSAKAEEIAALHPDLVLASVPYRMESLAEILKAGLRVVALAPKTLADVEGDIRLIASLAGRAEAGEELVAGIRVELESTRRTCAGARPQRVYCEEWGKPLIASQPWVAEMVEAAGGVVVGTPGAQSSAAEVAALDPELVLAAWCGAGSRVPLEKLAAREGWSLMSAVRERRLYCVSDELFNTPAHTLIGGLKAIRWALHPERFERPSGIRRVGEPA